MTALPRLRIGDPLVDDNGRLSTSAHRHFELLTKNIESQLGALQAAQLATTAAAAANAAAVVANTAATNVTAASNIANSYVTGLALTATDAGTNVTIAISAHTRVYGDGTSVAVNAGTLTTVPYSTIARIYYDDPTRAGGAVSYQRTTSLSTAAQSGARHSVGALTTPAAAGAAVTGNPVLPPGAALP